MELTDSTKRWETDRQTDRQTLGFPGKLIGRIDLNWLNFTCPLVYVSIYLYSYIYLCIYRSEYLSLDQPIHLWPHMCIYQFIPTSIYLHLYIYLSIYKSLSIYIYLSIYLSSIYLSIFTYFFLSVLAQNKQLHSLGTIIFEIIQKFHHKFKLRIEIYFEILLFQ